MPPALRIPWSQWEGRQVADLGSVSHLHHLALPHIPQPLAAQFHAAMSADSRSFVVTFSAYWHCSKVMGQPGVGSEPLVKGAVSSKGLDDFTPDNMTISEH